MPESRRRSFRIEHETKLPREPDQERRVFPPERPQTSQEILLAR